MTRPELHAWYEANPGVAPSVMLAAILMRAKMHMTLRVHQNTAMEELAVVMYEHARDRHAPNL